MSDQLQKSSPMIFENLPSAISSPASESGAMPFDSPESPTTDLFGREVAPVLPSRVPEKAKGLMTLATSGLLGHDSSESASLQRSLENRLMTRLDSAGSTLFRLTWKGRRTPLGRRYLERQALGLRTSGKGCTSVPTPKQPKFSRDLAKFEREPGRTRPTDLETTVTLASVPTPNTLDTIDREGLRPSRIATNRKSGYLTEIVPLASCPTPMAGSPATEDYNAAGNNDYSRKIVELATVSTPKSEDSQCAGADRGTADTLHSQVKLATVTSPSARDWKDSPGMSESGVDRDGSNRTRLDQLPRQAQLADSGATATGGTGATASSGQLNADYSRWLMGLPTVFSSCADSAMRYVRLLRRNSSQRQKKPLEK